MGRRRRDVARPNSHAPAERPAMYAASTVEVARWLDPKTHVSSLLSTTSAESAVAPETKNSTETVGSGGAPVVRVGEAMRGRLGTMGAPGCQAERRELAAM